MQIFMTSRIILYTHVDVFNIHVVLVFMCAALPYEGSEDPVLLAVSDVITFQNYNEPLQGHLVLTNDPTEVM